MNELVRLLNDPIINGPAVCMEAGINIDDLKYEINVKRDIPADMIWALFVVFAKRSLKLGNWSFYYDPRVDVFLTERHTKRWPRTIPWNPKVFVVQKRFETPQSLKSFLCGVTYPVGNSYDPYAEQPYYPNIDYEIFVKE